MSRRDCLALFGVALSSAAQQSPPPEADKKDWVCPMDPDVRSATPGVCPRCGMKLVLAVPDRKEYSLDVAQSPELLKPGGDARLTLRVFDPQSNSPVNKFETVHEKLIHLFVVSEDLEFFAHVHPVPQSDGSFVIEMKLPKSGMYRLLADFYPTGSVAQLVATTLYVSGPETVAHLRRSLDPCKATNLSASLRLDPEQPIAGLEAKLFFTLEPAAGLELYLGAWGHMLAASEDLIDLMHLHPFLSDAAKGQMQFNAIFPRAGLYRIWTQFQREGKVNTTVFTIPVRAL